MVLLFLIRLAKSPLLCERSVYSVYYMCLSWAFVKICVRPSFPFGIEGRMWDVIALIPDHCLSIHFTMLKSKPQHLS